MAQLAFYVIQTMFGGGMIADVATFMSGTSSNPGILKILRNMMQGEQLQTYMNIFIGVAASLVTLYFLADVAKRAGRDMLSIEQLVLTLIRFLTVFVILICSTDIISGVFTIGDGMFQMVNEGCQVAVDDSGIRFFTPVEEADTEDSVSESQKYAEATNTSKSTKEAVTASGTASKALAESSNRSKSDAKITGTINNGKGVKASELSSLSYKKVSSDMNNRTYGFAFMTNRLGTSIRVATCTILFWIICLISKILVYFTLISLALQAIAKTVFAPLAIVNTLGDDHHIVGIQYFKSLLATLTAFAVIMALLYAGGLLQGQLVKIFMDGKKTMSVWDMRTYMTNLKQFLPILAIQLSLAGACAIAPQMSKEIWGCR